MGLIMDPKTLKLVFHQVVRDKYKFEENFAPIEMGLCHVREGDPLTYQDLELIGDETYWPFSKFWMWPCKNQIEKMLEGTSGWFKKLPVNEKWVIDNLNGFFKNIALVSIILRFVCPDNYAIYSRPPLLIMRVERGATDTEEYLNYLNDLRLLAKSLGVNKISDADMIVWAIAHRSDLIIEFNQKLAEHLPENIVAKDLVNCLQDNPLKIAKAFNRQADFQTAGFWAAKAFEKFLEEECRKYPNEICPIPKLRHEKIEALIKGVTKWRDAYASQLLRDTKRECRNKIIPGIKRFTQDDVNLFIKNLIRLKQISG